MIAYMTGCYMAIVKRTHFSTIGNDQRQTNKQKQLCALWDGAGCHYNVIGQDKQCTSSASLPGRLALSASLETILFTWPHVLFRYASIF
jgi:hypothetical protein